MANPFESLLGTKATGKAQTGLGPGQSNIAEQVAGQETQQQMQKLDEAASLQEGQQGAQMEALQEEKKTQQQALKFRKQEEAASNMQQIQDMLQKSEFSELELENRQDALSLETASHKLMMEDASYVHQLREVGRRRRLNDEVSFQEELDRTVYGEELSMLLDELGWVEKNGEIARNNSEELFNMNVDIAMAVAAADTNQAQTEMMVQGMVNVGTAVGEDPKASKAIRDAFTTTPLTQPPTQTPEQIAFEKGIRGA